MPDTIKPYIKRNIPLANAVDISPSSYISIEFSERMNESTINEISIGLFKDPIEHVDITLDYNGGTNVLLIKPDDYMDYDERYAVVVSGTVQDYSGNRLPADYWWNFWTITEPSGAVYASGDQDQPEEPLLIDYINVISTNPSNYTTNYNTTLLDTIVINLSDYPAVGNRNFFGGIETYSAAFGEASYEDVGASLSGYLEVANQEVTGDPVIDHTPPTIDIQLSGKSLILNTTGILNNNEYIVKLAAGFPGLNTNPLQSDYNFVFTSTYSPLYIGYNLVRLNIGPILAITMNFVPNDTLNRIIYSVSRQADNLSPVIIDPTDLPWFVKEFVLYQTLLNGVYASIMMFASSGAGIKKSLGDLSIDIDANGLMPALLPIIEDYRKLRDKYQIMVENGTGQPAGPEWVVRAAGDPRRPITDNTWRRLPFNDLRSTNVSPHNNWVYTNDLNNMSYLTNERYLTEGRYVTSW